MFLPFFFKLIELVQNLKWGKQTRCDVISIISFQLQEKKVG